MCVSVCERERWSKNTMRKSKQLQIEECKWLIVEFSFVLFGGACFRFRPSKNVWKNILNYLLWGKRLNGAMHKLDSSHLVYYYSFQRRSVRWPSAHFPCLVSQLHRPSYRLRSPWCLRQPIQMQFKYILLHKWESSCGDDVTMRKIRWKI